MNTTRRHTAALLGMGLAAAAAPAWLRAQADKTLKMLVGFAPGGAADVVARAIAEGMRGAGYTSIVDNRAGAGGRLATEALLAAPADGATLLFTPSTNLTLYPHVYARLRYEMADFAPIGTACEFGFGLAVGANSPARTLADFLNQARQDPKLGAYGTAGAGTVMHFLGVMLARQANVPLIHVPYKGGSAALTDVVGGAVPALITTLPNLLPMHKAGKLRLLAVSSANPITEIPEVPTFKAAGYPELTASEYFCLFARRGTPPEVLSRLSVALTAAIASPSTKAVLEKLLFEPRTTAPKALASRLEADLERWGKTVKASGYTPEA